MQPYRPPKKTSRQRSIDRIPSPTQRPRTNGNTQALNQARPGVPDMQIEGLSSSGSQVQRPAQQPARQQQQPAQQSAQQQQQGQMQLPSHVGGAMGQMIPRGGGGFPSGGQIPQQPSGPMLPPSGAAGGLGTPAGGMQEVLPPIQMPAPQPYPGQDPRTPKVPGTYDGPTGTTGTGATDTGTTGTTGADPYAAEDAEFAEQLAGMDEDLEGLRGQAFADAAAQQRRQAEINAALGRSVGGGFGGAMAATSAQAVQDLATLESQVNAQKRSVQLAWLDKKLARKERELERDFNREMTDEERAHQMQMLALEVGVEAGLTATEINALTEEGTSATSGGAAGSGGQANTAEAAQQYAEEHTRSADDGGSLDSWPYEDGTYGRAGYTYGNASVDEDGYISFTGSNYSVNTDRVYDRINGILEDMGLDPESFIGKLKRGKRPVDPETGEPIPNFIGDNFSTSDRNMEFFAWYTQFMKDHSGQKPTDEDIHEKLAAIGVL